MKNRFVGSLLTPSALAVLIAIGASGCSDAPKPEETQATEQAVEVSQANPFLSEYTTAFEIPPFDKIDVSHYMPAVEQGMKEQLAEIDAIVESPEPATFANTIEAMERSGKLLSKTLRVFYNQTGAHTNDKLQELQRELSPVLSAHNDKINLNPGLFSRIKTIWEQKAQLQLSAEQTKLLDDTYKQFVRSGALLEGEAKQRLMEINAGISERTTAFGQNLLAETNAFELVLSDTDLDGLSEDIIAAASAAAKEKREKAETEADKAKYQGKYVFTPHRSSMYPFLTYSTRRDLREALYNAYVMRADNNNAQDNKLLVSEIAALRFERAQLLGYDTHADYVLEERMAKTPQAVYDLLEQLWKPALARAKVEVADMQEIISAEGHDFELAAWDWWHYAEKVRVAKYALDEASVKPYLSLDNVLDGAFTTANKLWGLTFTELFDVATYHPDVRVWEVKDADGSHLGIFMGDYFTRSSKRGGAWMSSYKGQSNFDGRERPVVVNVCNFPPPVGDTPSLLSFEQVTTLFHEFGHALHGMVTNATYPSQSGTAAPRDFTEFPAQIYEHWANEPSVLKTFAKHYKTGEVISDELIAKLQKASKFNQGFANTEYLAASILDMDWHTLTTSDQQDTDKFEKDSLAQMGLIPEIAPRYRSTYFAHIFAGGYASGYYSYIWSAVLDSDGFAAFEESGDIFDPELAKRYRTHVLEAGATEEAMTLYKKFRGRAPTIDALLKVRGLDGSAD